jgi:hypothetical protein
MADYTLTVRNDSFKSGSICIYQTLPDSMDPNLALPRLALNLGPSRDGRHLRLVPQLPVHVG